MCTCKKLIDLRRKTVLKICECIVDFLCINAGPFIEIAETPEVLLIRPFPVKDSFPNVVMSQHIVPRLANAMLKRDKLYLVFRNLQIQSGSEIRPFKN